MERGEEVVQLSLRVRVYVIYEINKGLMSLVVELLCEDMNLSIVY